MQQPKVEFDGDGNLCISAGGYDYKFSAEDVHALTAKGLANARDRHEDWLAHLALDSDNANSSVRRNGFDAGWHAGRKRGEGSSE